MCFFRAMILGSAWGHGLETRHPALCPTFSACGSLKWWDNWISSVTPSRKKYCNLTCASGNSLTLLKSHPFESGVPKKAADLQFTRSPEEHVIKHQDVK